MKEEKFCNPTPITRWCSNHQHFMLTLDEADDQGATGFERKTAPATPAAPKMCDKENLTAFGGVWKCPRLSGHKGKCGAREWPSDFLPPPEAGKNGAKL